MSERCIFSHSSLYGYCRIERLIGDLYCLTRVLGVVAAIRDDHDDGLSYVCHLTAERLLCNSLKCWMRKEEREGWECCVKWTVDGNDARHLHSSRGIDIQDSCVRVDAADKCGMQHPR